MSKSYWELTTFWPSTPPPAPWMWMPVTGPYLSSGMRGSIFNGREIAPAARDGGDVAVLSTLLHCLAQVAAHPCRAESGRSGKNVMTQLEVKKKPEWQKDTRHCLQKHHDAVGTSAKSLSHLESRPFLPLLLIHTL